MPKQNVCHKLSFEDCELTILRMAVDKAEEKIGKRTVNSSEIQKIIKIVEDFIKRKNLICYGGTAINNILPEEDQFYNKDVELPDYDFFTTNALKHAKELAEIYYKEGFTNVEAKSGQHFGTYKVFVNYIPIADLTHIPQEIYDSIKQDAIRVGGILYTPPNYLRMAMYLELSRPDGDISRWEKVLKRLSLLNKHYPLNNVKCDNIDFQRDMSGETEENEIVETVKNALINQGCVFFGGFAMSLYSRYMPNKTKKQTEQVADFDVLTNEPDITAEIVKERLKDIGIKNVKIIKREPVGEIIPVHYEILVGKDTIAFIYKPIACHSYNVITVSGRSAKIATIDTMLSFYLAFLYTNRPYYNNFLDRILCMSKYLFEVQQKNRLEQKGLLKRFSINCYGHQETIEEMRAHKSDKYKELKGNKKEFEKWFLNYKPENASSSRTFDKTTENNKKNKKTQRKKGTYLYKKKKRKTKKNKLFAIY